MNLTRWRRHRIATAVALAALLLSSSCASPQSSGSQEEPPGASRTAAAPSAFFERCGEGSQYLFGPDLAPDYSNDSLFTISELSADTNGGALIRYNANTPEAGSDDTDAPSRLIEVLPDRTVHAVGEASLGGGTTVLPENLYPLAAHPQGGQYLFDSASYMVVLRGSDGAWSPVANLPRGSVFKSPSLAVGPEGTVYIATASQVLSIGPEGEMEPVAGTPIAASEIVFPQIPLVGLPLPAPEVELPSPTAMVVDDGGAIHISTANTIYRITDGLLSVEHILGTTVKTPDEALGPPNVTGLAIDEAGQLIISDSANEIVYTVTGDSTAPVTDQTRFISDGVVGSRTLSAPLLAVDSNQEVACVL